MTSKKLYRVLLNKSVEPSKDNSSPRLRNAKVMAHRVPRTGQKYTTLLQDSYTWHIRQCQRVDICHQRKLNALCYIGIYFSFSNRKKLINKSNTILVFFVRREAGTSRVFFVVVAVVFWGEHKVTSIRTGYFLGFILSLNLWQSH